MRDVSKLQNGLTELELVLDTTRPLYHTSSWAYLAAQTMPGTGSLNGGTEVVLER